MIYPLVPANHPQLKIKAERFDFYNPPVSPLELAVDLSESMMYNNGIGLAANQLGWPYRAFSVLADPLIVCFNPFIVDTSEETVELEEGCLTFPGLILKISRPKSIKIRYTQPNGETVTNIYTGMTARIMQHEIDHLNGHLFTELVGPVALALAKNKASKIRR